MAEFFSMGGYGAYIWPSYAMTAIILAALLLASIRELKSTEAMFERLKAQVAPNKNKNNNKETPDGDEA